MSINLTCPAYYTCRRLSFGVPLEDVFPPGELHPGLKSLFIQSYENVATKSSSVEEVLSGCQGSLHERLALKEKVVLCKEIKNFRTPPGAPLWVIRHFIGLLPIQLLPKHIGDQKYFWWKFTKECKKCLSTYPTSGRNNSELLHRLTSEILRLPCHNFLLLATLLNFLRMLSVLPGGEPRVNKTTLFCLVKYFSSCVFVRPFRPGCVTKVDKQFYPLMLYLILKWPEIRRICIETSNYSFELPLEEIYPGFSEKSHTPGQIHYFFKHSNDNAVQTSFNKETRLEQSETLIRMVPRSYNEFSFLRDIACQTDFEVSKPKSFFHDLEISRQNSCCCCLGSHYERSPRSQWRTELNDVATKTSKMTFIRSRGHCTYSENCQTNCQYAESPELIRETTNPKPYGWNIGEVETNNLFFSPNSDFTGSTNYSYDDYDTCNLICDSEVDEGSYFLVKTFDPVQKEENEDKNKNLKGDLSEMGLFSTPIADFKLEKDVRIGKTADSTKSVHSVGWTIPHDYENMYRELRESLHKELKEKLSSMKLKPLPSEKGSDAGENAKSDCEGQKDADQRSYRKMTETKKSLLSINKIKSRLDLLRIFKNKKARPRKSRSCDQVSGGFKYEKMGSASSLL